MRYEVAEGRKSIDETDPMAPLAHLLRSPEDPMILPQTWETSGAGELGETRSVSPSEDRAEGTPPGVETTHLNLAFDG